MGEMRGTSRRIAEHDDNPVVGPIVVGAEEGGFGYLRYRAEFGVIDLERNQTPGVASRELGESVRPLSSIGESNSAHRPGGRAQTGLGSTARLWLRDDEHGCMRTI
jgi:hypothetical protein